MRWFSSGRFTILPCRAVVVGLLVSGVLAADARAQQGRAAMPGARVTEQWEDVLLLQAIRTLRLSPAQLREALPLAEAAAARLAQLDSQEKATRARLDRLAEENRAALLAGRPGKDQAEVLALREAMKGRRAQAEDQVVDYVAPRLAQLLTREQILRACLLTLGRPLQGELDSPALHDPPAGFVLGEGAREEWRDSALRQALSRRYPAGVVSALSPLTLKFALDSGVLLEGVTFRYKVLTAPVELGIERAELPLTDHVIAALALSTAEAVDDAQLHRVRKEFDLRREAWNRSPAQLIAQAGEPELTSLLRHLARRMFLSPRLVPVLQERVASVSPPEAGDEPELGEREGSGR